MNRQEIEQVVGQELAKGIYILAVGPGVRFRLHYARIPVVGETIVLPGPWGHDKHSYGTVTRIEHLPVYAHDYGDAGAYAAVVHFE